MSACAQQVFNGITQPRWDCIKSAVKAKTGIVITTDSGSATQSSFSVHWNFDPAKQTLSIQCTDKPWIVPCSTVESAIKGVVNGCP